MSSTGMSLTFYQSRRLGRTNKRIPKELTRLMIIEFLEAFRLRKPYLYMKHHLIEYIQNMNLVRYLAIVSRRNI